MKLTERGIAQIVFGFLPQQTADLNNRVWRVKRWSNPNYVALDQEILRGELLSAIHPWDGLDNGLAARLQSKTEVHVLTPSRSGIEVEPFPRLFRCKKCSRLERSFENPCKCGAKSWAAFPFVAFHSCGFIQEPFIAVCDKHKQVKVNNPKSNNARDVQFSCPVCPTRVQNGFRWLNCECGQGTLDYTVHRAGAVFNPHSLVVVNPPNEELARQLRSTSARLDTLQWVLNGMAEEKPLDDSLNIETLIEMFKASGVTEAVAHSMAHAAAAQSGGKLASGKNDIPLSASAKDRAAGAALKIAYATSGGRTTFENLLDRASSTMQQRYEIQYPAAVRACGLERVELLDEFPVLTAYFGYTRGNGKAGTSHLRWYKDEKGRPQLYGLRARTEALMFTLDPIAVAGWLFDQGALKSVPSNPRDARLAILETCEVPRAGDVDQAGTPGGLLLTLVHSCSHRMIRTMASFAGTDRDGLAEYIVPEHLTFIIYARSTSDFVLGGLQALYENDLNGALHEYLHAEMRCPLDPGCMQNGGACMACLHTGEPSCRHFNQFLGRPALFSQVGFLSPRRHKVTI